MNKQQLAWASQHDWFVRSSFEGYVIVRDWPEALSSPVLRTFRDYQELREWAGY